jgi:hypothetical protein
MDIIGVTPQEALSPLTEPCLAEINREWVGNSRMLQEPAWIAMWR